jgi:hypothetical protein
MNTLSQRSRELLSRSELFLGLPLPIALLPAVSEPARRVPIRSLTKQPSFGFVMVHT